jgi:hypothetical protein
MRPILIHRHLGQGNDPRVGEITLTRGGRVTLGLPTYVGNDIEA